MYISNLIYKCYKWEFILMNAVPFSFKQMKEKLSLICKQNLWTRTWHMKNRPWDLLWELFFAFEFQHQLSSFVWFYTCLYFFFFMLLYFRGFLQYCIHIYYFFFSLSCNRTDCLHSLLKRNDLNSSTKWNLFSRLYYVLCNCH